MARAQVISHLGFHLPAAFLISSLSAVSSNLTMPNYRHQICTQNTQGIDSLENTARYIRVKIVPFEIARMPIPRYRGDVLY